MQLSQSSDEIAQDLYRDVSSRLSLLPRDMFNYYFLQGYLFSLTQNCGRLNRILPCHSPAAMVICNDDYLLIMSSKKRCSNLLMYNRRASKILWTRNIVIPNIMAITFHHYNDLVGMCESCEIVIYAKKSIRRIDCDTGEVKSTVVGINTVEKCNRNGVGILYRPRASGDFTISFDNLSERWGGEITLPQSQTSSIEELGVFQHYAYAINDNNTVAVVHDKQLFIFRFDGDKYKTGEFNLTRYGSWQQTPIDITSDIKQLVIDNDENVLLLYENSCAIYNRAGLLVKQFAARLKNVTVYDGIIYGCIDRGRSIVFREGVEKTDVSESQPASEGVVVLK